MQIANISLDRDLCYWKLLNARLEHSPENQLRTPAIDLAVALLFYITAADPVTLFSCAIVFT